jgi:hypothetical protein
VITNKRTVPNTPFITNVAKEIYNTQKQETKEPRDPVTKLTKSSKVTQDVLQPTFKLEMYTPQQEQQQV